MNSKFIFFFYSPFWKKIRKKITDSHYYLTSVTFVNLVSENDVMGHGYNCHRARTLSSLISGANLLKTADIPFLSQRKRAMHLLLSWASLTCQKSVLLLLPIFEKNEFLGFRKNVSYLFFFSETAIEKEESESLLECAIFCSYLVFSDYDRLMNKKGETKLKRKGKKDFERRWIFSSIFFTAHQRHSISFLPV